MVDGINALSTATGSILGDSSTGYLYSALTPDIRRTILQTIGPVQPFYWSNDANYTSASVESLATILRAAYLQTRAAGAPLIVVSHSWGTVLSYIVLEQNPDIVVDKLITLGSR